MRSGALDLPANCELVDHLFLSTHRLSTPSGPIDAEEARVRISTREIIPATAVEGSGVSITISERWHSPAPWIVARFLAAGVSVHVSSGSRSPETVA